MKNILCDDCKQIIGMIEENTYVDCDDNFYGVEILCKKCKDKKPSDYWREGGGYHFRDANVLFHNQDVVGG